MSLFARSQPKWWSSLLVLVVFCLTLVQPVSAAAPTSSSDLITLLREYNIVRGDDRGDLQLGAPITRAQMAVILVRLNRREADGENLKGLSLFADTKGHWAEGYVASARINGLMKGFEDGSFRPEEPVTYAQALTLVVRLVGREPAASSWPTSALLEAMDLKVVPAGFTGVAMLNEPAVRGEIFVSLAQALTTVKTPEGLTYFQKYLDSNAPELSVGDATTLDASYQIKGTAKGAARVLVNGEAATLTGDAFTKTVSLVIGENRYTVEAYDLAGNKAAKEIKIVRGSPAATMSITGPTKVQIGGTAAYEIKAFDDKGTEVSAAGVQARVTGNIGTFDAATRTFRAAQTAGTGKIELTLGTATASINVQVLGVSTKGAALSAGANSVAYTRPMTVTVRVLDAGGELVDEDYGRTVSLSATGVAGLTVTPAQAVTSGGVATFAVRATETGNVSFTATSQGLAGATATSVFTTTTRIVLVTEQSRIPTDGSLYARIRAELRDDNNNLVANKTGSDIYVNLSITGPGSLLQPRVRIAPSATSSAQTQSDGLVGASVEAGTISVRGQLEDTTLKYSVEPLSVQSYQPTAGSGTKFRVTPIVGSLTVGTATPAEFVIQLVDTHGSVIGANDYAFQVEVTTSNNEPKVNGVPEGVSVWLGDRQTLSPVSDGKAGGDDITARTYRGNAVVKLSYDKSGTVTLKVVPVSGSSQAYNTDGTPGDASGSSSAWITDESKAVATWRAEANTIKITADSDLFGKDAPAINNRAGTARTYTLNAYVAYRDPNNASAPRYWVPGQIKTLDLYKNGTKVATAEARDGKATFSISASGATDAAEDSYQVKDPAATGKLEDSNRVYVRTDARVPEAPGFPVTRGVPSLTLDQVRANDTGLEIDIPGDTTQRYVMVMVYHDGNHYSPIYTVGPVDVSAGKQTITVPKDKLPNGVQSYYVRYRNAYGDSERGVYSYPVTNFTLSSSVSISNAKYDAVNKILYIYGSGFSRDDAFAGENLRLFDPVANQSVYLGGAFAEYVNNSTYKLTLTGLSTADLNTLATFAGNVRLSADVGWITKANGQMGNEDLNNGVGPMAYIDSAAYDRTNHRLVIYGRGFKTGTFKPALVKVGTHALNGTGISVNVAYDNEVWVTLSTTVAAAVEADKTLAVTAENGWLTDGQSTPVGQMAAQGPITVSAYVRTSSVAFVENTQKVTISGTGFAGGRVPSGASVKIVRSGKPDLTLINGTVTPDGKVTFDFNSEADQKDFVDNFNTYRTTTYLVAADGWFEVPAGTDWRAAQGIPQSTGLRVNKVAQ